MADMHTPLNCPFCGKEPILIKMVEDDGFDRWHKVMCEECGIEMGDEYRSDAIAAWNRRSPSQDAETIKALEAQIATKDAALRDADYALSNLIDGFEFDDDDPDGPCHAEELCGERMCDDCGCLKDKRDAARAALAGSAS